ncbi:hypothetical protein VNO77_41781 [Canavalia gladiata]|uniref:Uncharacterized protein n=1 Tax=Canavalia gladiata TaxID=3824 RepID=A0AAN9K237_CANGL
MCSATRATQPCDLHRIICRAAGGVNPSFHGPHGPLLGVTDEIMPQGMPRFDMTNLEQENKTWKFCQFLVQSSIKNTNSRSESNHRVGNALKLSEISRKPGAAEGSSKSYAASGSVFSGSYGFSLEGWVLESYRGCWRLVGYGEVSTLPLDSRLSSVDSTHVLPLPIEAAKLSSSRIHRSQNLDSVIVDYSNPCYRLTLCARGRLFVQKPKPEVGILIGGLREGLECNKGQSESDNHEINTTLIRITLTVILYNWFQSLGVHPNPYQDHTREPLGKSFCQRISSQGSKGVRAGVKTYPSTWHIAKFLGY